ncbi:hypothetical protein [Mycolicibacterium sphagni]|uniref:DUF2631 domain-containing protein n=1 Tax=Mycolicibacterium sphagni TaxID=1786 RepID=A0ABX2JYT0_9MYCO|nr:hypothetical protein [Mycolicibacterium sphagni]NTY62545.1 hypothetical protein [Mycolicibacterium sphagni]
MSNNDVSTGEPAKVFTGIRDVPIYAGESSAGNRLPGGPYRSAELIAIGLIMGPALWWFRTHEGGGFTVLAGAAAAAVVVTIILRMVLPTRRPSLLARASFAVSSIFPTHACAARPHARSSHGAQR